jgi:hypothetical protein
MIRATPVQCALRSPDHMIFSRAILKLAGRLSKQCRECRSSSFVSAVRCRSLSIRRGQALGDSAIADGSAVATRDQARQLAPSRVQVGDLVVDYREAADLAPVGRAGSARLAAASATCMFALSGRAACGRLSPGQVCAHFCRSRHQATILKPVIRAV